MEKIVKSIDELLLCVKKDCFYFVNCGNLGDLYYLCLFKEAVEQKYKGRIIFVIREHERLVCELFNIRDFISCDRDLIAQFYYPQWIKTPNTKSVPTLGKFYPAHPMFLQKPQAWDITNMRDYFLRFLDLPQDTKIKLPTSLPQMNDNLKAKINKIAPLGKIILFLPETTSCPCLPMVIFKKECEKLVKQGYFIIVNIPKHKEYKRFFTQNVYDLDLSVKECFTLALSCAGVVAVRSGFVDLISVHVKDLKIYYTAFVHWFVCHCLENELGKLEEKFVYDESIYKEFLRHKTRCFESLPLKLYERYGKKGFLRKLRMPFTLYFKIYQRYKKAQHLSSKDEWLDELLLKTLTQTYEYQLALALQRACERFFYGGFIFFAFDYLKIRKQKGKKLIRMKELFEILEPHKSLFFPENQT